MANGIIWDDRQARFVIGPSGVGASMDFIYDPSAPSTVTPIYKTLAELMAAVSDGPPGARVMWRSNAIIPAGLWTLPLGTMFFALTPATGQVTVTLAAGAILDNLRGIRFGLVLKPLNTAACLKWTADGSGPSVFYVADGAALDRSASGADLAQIPDNTYGVYACNQDSNRVVPAPAVGKGVLRGMGPGTVLIGSQSGAVAFGGILPGDFVGSGNIILHNGIGSSVLSAADFPGLTLLSQVYGADPRNFGPQDAGKTLSGPAAGPPALPTFRL